MGAARQVAEDLYEDRRVEVASSTQDEVISLMCMWSHAVQALHTTDKQQHTSLKAYAKGKRHGKESKKVPPPGKLSWNLARTFFYCIPLAFVFASLLLVGWLIGCGCDCDYD